MASHDEESTSHETIERHLPRWYSAGFGRAGHGLLLMGADDPKQTIDAKGLTFEAPKSWKSSPPRRQMRTAQLKVEPIEGDDYPAELVVFAFRGGAGSVEDNLKRWQRLFKDKDGNPPKIESKKVQGKNVEVTQAETSGHYYPASFGGTKEPDRGRRPTSRRHRHGRKGQLLHPDGRSRQDDEETDGRLRRDGQDDQAGREVIAAGRA